MTSQGYPIRAIRFDSTTSGDAAEDTFLIPNGFAGVWETVEPVRKFYVVFKRAPG